MHQRWLFVGCCLLTVVNCRPMQRRRQVPWQQPPAKTVAPVINSYLKFGQYPSPIVYEPVFPQATFQQPPPPTPPQSTASGYYYPPQTATTPHWMTTTTMLPLSTTTAFIDVQQRMAMDDDQIEEEYERIWNQMIHLWIQMTHRVEDSGLDKDWQNFWSKLGNTVEPFISQFSQQISEVFGVAARQQLQQSSVTPMIDSLKQLAGELAGDQQSQSSVQQLFETMFPTLLNELQSTTPRTTSIYGK